MQISILATFVAGVISFPFPYVLSLVPNYVTMLSGIGVEQLRHGKKPRGGFPAGCKMANDCAKSRAN